MKFAHTEAAAKAEKQSKWELIEAIATDAVENDLPITGIDSCLAAKKAIEVAGEELADRTIENYCMAAKFDYESTAKQRRVWRRYGVGMITEVSKAGWSQEAAFDLLVGERKTVQQAREAFRKAAGRNVAVADVPIGTAWGKWADRMLGLLMDGAELANRTDDVDGLDPHAAMAYLIYQRISERQIDAELRTMLETAEQ